MKLREIFENPKQSKHVTFCFGRMNPPHYGHGSLITKVQTVAGKGDWFVFTSKSQDPKKNPLPYSNKLAWLQTLFPQLGKHLVPNAEIKTFLQAAAYLYLKGYTSATFVAGDEDMTLMQPTLEKYNGVESKHGVYNFNPLSFVENIRETSATSARQAAIDGNQKAFEQATQVPADVTVNGLTLFQAVRQGMGLQDQIADPKEKELAEGSNKDEMPKSLKLAGPRFMTTPKANLNGGDAYLNYRMNLALAGAPDYPTKAESEIGGDPLYTSYTEQEFEMIQIAAKIAGAGPIKKLNRQKSEELPTTNKTSTVAKIKRNKYGI